MIELKSRDTWIEIDLEILASNLDYIIEKANGKTIWPAIKSNAYQHGIDGVFETFIKKGIHHFCVAYIDEAEHIQNLADKLGVSVEILIFGDVPHEYLKNIKSNWILTVASLDYAMLLKNTKYNTPLTIHIKIDSGMNRRGFKTKESFDEALDILEQLPYVCIDGVYSHLATADNQPNEEFKRIQSQRFLEFIVSKKMMFNEIHLQNSQGLLTLTEEETSMFTGTRPGAICYGLGVKNKKIKPIASLYTRIMETKPISKGEFVGYNITFEAPDDGYIAILPIGYADGILRSNTGNTVYINEIPVPIVGRVCMEQCMIYTTDSSLFEQGAKVTFFNENHPIEHIANYNHTIDYEIMCNLSSRIPRIYIEKEREVNE